MPLTDEQQIALARVLDFKLSLNRRSLPQLQPLSLYSSELKGTKQIAGCLQRIRDHGDLADSDISRQRYFNSLFNQGLVEGSWRRPALTQLANEYLGPLDSGVDDAFWQGDGGDEIEFTIIGALARRLSEYGTASDAFKVAWYGAQAFFEYVPRDELDTVLADRAKLLFLYRINSNGWEIGRYFRLNAAERQAFEADFDRIRPTAEQHPTSPIEEAAALYKDAADKIQSDVRFRISGFLNAYNRLKVEMGAALPRLDRQLTLRLGGIDEDVRGPNSSTDAGISPVVPVSISTVAPAVPLKHPHQLIVTGCPGSGKSFYVESLTKDADYVIRTQFHPESSFFDFVGAYKPQPVYERADQANPLEEGDGTAGIRGKPLIDYRYVPGPLMRGLVHALQHPDQNVVVLVEEINRGNAAAILGDVLQLLDRDEEGSSRYELEATTEQRAFLASMGIRRNSIGLPANLYLWATMNSADQGVFPLDTAFRRRWSYVYKGFAEPCSYPAASAVVVYDGKRYGWDDFRGAINNFLIGLGVHEDKLIGPYFLTEGQLASPDAVLEKMFLYLWDDVLRFRQDTLFNERSFSAVTKVWNKGEGAPLKVEMPAPLSTPATVAISIAESSVAASDAFGTSDNAPAASGGAVVS